MEYTISCEDTPTQCAKIGTFQTVRVNNTNMTVPQYVAPTPSIDTAVVCFVKMSQHCFHTDEAKIGHTT